MSRFLHIGGRKKVAASKREKDPFALRPERDWKILFCIAVTVNVLVIAFHSFIFYNITQGAIFRPHEIAAPETVNVDQVALTESLEHFRVKERELADVIATPPTAPAVR